MNRERLEKIMAFADGELGEAERAEVEALLASDAEARSALADVRVLGDAVRAADDAPEPPADLVDGLFARLEGEAPPAPEKGKVVPFPAKAARRSGGAVVVAALALAASVAFVVGARREADRTASTGAALPPAEEPGVEVEAVESPSRSVSVFYLPSAASSAASGVVVWVDDDGADDQAPEPEPEGSPAPAPAGEPR